MIDADYRERVKELIAYNEYKERIDATTGFSDFDFPIAKVERNSKYVLTVYCPGGRYFFLPIYNSDLLLKEEEEARKAAEARIEAERKAAEAEKRLQIKKEEEFLEKRGAMLDKIAKRAASRESSGDEGGIIDGAAWWSFLERYYPKNYSAAEVFYNRDGTHSDSPIRKRFFDIAPDAMINDFFAAIGLPAIKAVNGEIKVDGRVVATYDGVRIDKGGQITQYRNDSYD